MKTRFPHESPYPQSLDARLFAVLGDARVRLILDRLRMGPCRISDLADLATPVHDLQIRLDELYVLGLVSATHTELAPLYSFDPRGFEALRRWLSYFPVDASGLEVPEN